MSDIATPAAEPVVPAAQDGAPAPVEGQAPVVDADNIDALPDWAKKHIKDLRAENAKTRKTAKEIEAQQTEAQRLTAIEQGKYKELYEKAEQEKQALAAQVQEAQLRDMRSKAIEAAGLPKEFAERLKGDTEEAMAEDAKALAALWKKANVQKVPNDAANGTGGKAPSTVNTLGAAKQFNLQNAQRVLEKAGN